ncbi:hypothetical protein GCM10028783_31620 [Modestobacter muralis]|nr:maleylpyruvate isomerase N-terminal domain-containing protein [Modestobacter muralis]
MFAESGLGLTLTAPRREQTNHFLGVSSSVPRSGATGPGTARPVHAVHEVYGRAVSALADQVIVSLRQHHDQLVEVIDGLDDEQLVAPSGASEWRICDVLSHLGSGSEIMLRPLAAAAAGTGVPGGDNQAVWDRWNAMTPREQAQGYVDHGTVLVETPRVPDARAARRGHHPPTAAP